MEAVKEIKGVKENGQGKELKSILPLEPGTVQFNPEITQEDLNNLKQVFTWALSVTVKNRDILASIITFEDVLFKKLTKK